jgi:hypothetical protein
MEDIRIAPDDDLLNICSDPVLKAVLTKDTPESRGFLLFTLSSSLGKPVTDVVVRQNEPVIDDVRDKQIRFDV